MNHTKQKQTESTYVRVIECTWVCSSQNAICGFPKEQFPGPPQHTLHGKIRMPPFRTQRPKLWLLQERNRPDLLFIIVLTIFPALFPFYSSSPEKTLFLLVLLLSKVIFFKFGGNSLWNSKCSQLCCLWCLSSSEMCFSSIPPFRSVFPSSDERR